MERVAERFCSYVKVHTTSVDEAGKVPSFEGEWDLARKLARELLGMGIENAHVDENCFVLASIESNIEKSVPAIGFFAHLDTSPDEPGKDVKPQFFGNYQGGELVLNEGKGIKMSPEQYGVLNDYVGHDLITSDGTTLLGADDKAGIAIIMEMANRVMEHPEFKHGKIVIAFTPDEEVSPGGAEMFDVATLGADFAYTVDGEGMSEFNCETFNAAGAVVVFKGENIHPGEGKDKMVNASLMAAEFISALPEKETPAHTEDREGFYHLTSMGGDVAEAKLEYIIRDFDLDALKEKKKTMEEAAAAVNRKYGENRVKLTITDQYYNMAEVLKDRKDIIDLALEAYRECGVAAEVQPIRGGTDGARFSQMGLPTPNIFAAGHNYHSKYEFASVNAMEKATEILLRIVELNAR